MRARGFDAVAACDARVLILGSMPGRESIRQQQYYAHPRNAFWPIMARLFGFDAHLPYAERLARLKAAHIALWDVAHSCSRKGSLDADIRDAVANDFATFFRAHPLISHVFFNGATAERMFRRMVLPGLDLTSRRLAMTRLASTSPAHAAMNVEQKLLNWQQVRQALESSAG